ncbi:MAG: hypothetical protein OXH57_00430 [Ekhidna sp.]|nr:hypothetical protein [Ekhidna sp.]
MSEKELDKKLLDVLGEYSKSFSNKEYVDEFNETDVLMDAFGITQDLKRENKQYWGRELGKCWESLLKTLFEATCDDFAPPKRFGADEPADFFAGTDAIDTKYRVGSGDSGTLKKFESYGKLLQAEGYRPVSLFLRFDNLKAALSKMDAGGWTRFENDEAFEYIKEKTKFDLKAWLIKLSNSGSIKVNRDNG